MLGDRYDVVWEDQPRPRPKSGGRPGFSRWAMVVSGIALLAILGLVLTWPEKQGDEFDGVPRELSGRWVTSDPRYAERMLIIERYRVALMLELGPAGRERHPIEEVRVWNVPDGRGYRIRYGIDGTQSVDVFIAHDGTLRLKHPSDVVWRRLPFVY
jgi:hypothetical protein